MKVWFLDSADFCILKQQCYSVWGFAAGHCRMLFSRQSIFLMLFYSLSSIKFARSLSHLSHQWLAQAAIFGISLSLYGQPDTIPDQGHSAGLSAGLFTAGAESGDSTCQNCRFHCSWSHWWWDHWLLGTAYAGVYTSIRPVLYKLIVAFYSAWKSGPVRSFAYFW